jgi:2,4-dienoyl-CoA reductase-like NADH-dependent reductase (Old Yellow Enzyme family)/thioredoxin reductase
MTRRGFLGAAAGAGTLTAAGMLAAAGCSPQSQPASGKADGQGGSDAPAPSQAGALNPQEDYTAYTTDYAALFSPVQIGKLTLKNRIVKSPGGSDTWVPVGDQLNDNYLDYYENFAKGGAAAVFTESSIAAYIGINVAERKGTGWLGARLDMAKELLSPVVERVHKHDAYIGFQLAGPGGVEGVDFTTFSIDDIHWIQQIMTDTAVAYKDAGFDICELHCAAQQVLNTLMTPRGNKRTDEYGADTVANRTRFTCELIKMIKSACGQDYPIQILMNAVEENDQALGDNDGFLNLQDCIENAKAFEAAGADSIYLRLNVPGLHIAQFAPDLMFSGYRCEGINGFGARVDFSQHFGGALNGQWSGCALLLKACAEFKKNLGITVSCAGYMDPRTAPDLINGAIANGEIDYLMITRPLTVDTELPNKLKEGRRDEVAPCCRCMHCHNKGGPDGSGPEWCRVNAVTQHAYTDVMPEGYELLPAAAKKSVMVVGGGPAGMEAARIAAKRGHAVKLYEKGASLGGLVRTAHAYKGDHERLGDLIDYLARQQEVNGVELVMGTEVDAALVKSEKPDAVIVAVGGKRTAKLASSSKTNVISIDDVQGSEIGGKVVVCGAGAQAIDLTLYLLAQGKKVQMVHSGPRKDVDKEQSMWVRNYVRPQLFSQGVKIWSKAAIVDVIDGGMRITDQLGTSVTIECDTVIECYDMEAQTSLYDNIKGDFEAYAVGDCAAPYNIADAILSGNLAARKL